MASNYTQRRWIRRSVVLAVAIAAAIAAFCVYQGVSVSLEAERTLHATHAVTLKIERYLVSHNGAWPTSWADLEAAASDGDDGPAWLTEADLRERVFVDFDIDVNDVADGRIDVGAAIRPIGPCYEGYSNFFEPLRKVILRLRSEGRLPPRRHAATTAPRG